MYGRGGRRSSFRTNPTVSHGGYSGRGNLRAGTSMIPPTGQLLLSITHAELNSELPSKEAPQITDCEYVASYSWLGQTEPMIYVPGIPPTWTPPKSSQTLKPDAGVYYRDPNAARWPNYPTEPAVRAVLLQSDHVDDLDVFGCGSTMGNLLRFARGIDASFKFDVDVVGNTVFFVRKENSPTETIKGVRGYGHTFPEAFTSWHEDVKGSESHQRLIRYDLGGLNILIRFESDGHFQEAGEYVGEKGKTPEHTIVDDVESALQGLTSFDTKKQTTSNNSRGKLAVIPSGHPVPQTAVFDIKTRGHRNLITMDDVYPVLWLKQIPNFIIAYHEYGNFNDIQMQELSAEIQKWQAAHANELRKFVILIRKIVEYAREMAGIKLEVYRPPILDPLAGDELQIREQANGGVDILPSDLKEQWVLATARSGSLGVDATDDEASSNDEGDIADYTNCSEECGYCGKCRRKVEK